MTVNYRHSKFYSTLKCIVRFRKYLLVPFKSKAKTLFQTSQFHSSLTKHFQSCFQIYHLKLTVQYDEWIYKFKQFLIIHYHLKFNWLFSLSWTKRIWTAVKMQYATFRSVTVSSFSSKSILRISKLCVCCPASPSFWKSCTIGCSGAPQEQFFKSSRGRKTVCHVFRPWWALSSLAMYVASWKSP